MPSMSSEERANKKQAGKLADPFKFMSSAEANKLLDCRTKANTLFFLHPTKSRIGVIAESYTFPIWNPQKPGATTREKLEAANSVRKVFFSNSLHIYADKFSETVKSLATHDEATLKTLKAALCTVKTMQIMANGCVHKTKSVEGKGGKGKPVAIASETTYTVEQGIARQVFWFFNSCSRDDDFRTAAFDALFLELPLDDDKKVDLPETGSDAAIELWCRVSNMFFGVAEKPVEVMVDEDDGMPIPSIQITTEGNKKVSALLSALNQEDCDENQKVVRSLIKDNDVAITYPRYRIGCTVQVSSTDPNEDPDQDPVPHGCDEVHAMDHRKFVELPSWALNRLRNLASRLLGEVPSVLEMADNKAVTFDLVEAASNHFTNEFETWDEGDDNTRNNALRRLAVSPWRYPVVTKILETQEKVRELVVYTTPEQKSVVDTFFVAPGHHDAEEHCADSYKKYRREIDSLLKPVIADAINYKIKHPLIVVDGTGKKATKRKSPSTSGGRGGASSSSIGPALSSEETYTLVSRAVEEQVKKRFKVLYDHFGLKDPEEEVAEE